MPLIMAATGIPYVFTGVEAFPDDLIAKAAKAQWYARNEGMAYGKLLISCPLNWKTEDRAGTEIVAGAVDSCFFPLYEIERGHTAITYDPEALERRIPIGDWFAKMGKTKHLLRSEFEADLHEIEHETERRWERLRAMHASEVL
jgi:pyruvate ferredoxin oxidoreductase alpha subunit